MVELLVIFGIMGLMFIPLILMFLVCGVDKTHKRGGAIVMAIIWVVFAFGLFYEIKTNETVWNDGFCECGTHWELKGVSKYRNHEIKYYACPDCYVEIEIHN